MIKIFIQFVKRIILIIKKKRGDENTEEETSPHKKFISGGTPEPPAIFGISCFTRYARIIVPRVFAPRHFRNINSRQTHTNRRAALRCSERCRHRRPCNTKHTKTQTRRRCRTPNATPRVHILCVNPLV